METEQMMLLEDDAITVEVRLSYLHGWEWRLRYREGTQWSLLESGLAKSSADALVEVADALVDLAHATPF